MHSLEKAFAFGSSEAIHHTSNTSQLSVFILTMHPSTALFMALAFGGAQAFRFSFLVPKPVATGSSRCRLDSTPTANENHHAVTVTSDRRAFVLSSFAAATSLAVNLSFPSPSHAAASVDYKAVSADIASMIKKDPDRGPTLVRLAWHSSGTYDKTSKTGGSGGGTIRFKDELDHAANAGLASTAVKWMEPIYKKYDGLSYADLYTLGGGMLLVS
jgi:catalase (peroxidase I)